MSLIIPNATDTTGGNKYDSLDQAEPDALDFEILSLRGSGVVSGCEVTSAGTSNTVNVAAGVIILNGASYAVSASSGFGLPTAPADKRFDIIVARVSGGVASLVAVQGANSATNPEFPKSASVITGAPSPTTNVNFATDVVLAAVYRNGSSTVTTSRITDKRVTVTSGISDQGASAPATSYGSGPGALYYKTGTPSGTSSGVYVKTTTGDWIELAQNVGPHVPIGGAILWPSTSAVPSRFVEANGQGLSTTAYSALFAQYGYTHGGAGGTFNVPNYNNLYIRGTTNTSAVGTTVGADSVTLTTNQLPAHYHTMDHTHGIAHTHNIDHSHGATTGSGGSHSHTIDHNHAAFSTASGGSHFHTVDAGTVFIYAASSGSIYIMATTSFTANDFPYTYSPYTATDGTHTHTIDVPAFSGSSSTAAAHVHSVSVEATSGLLTSSQSTSNTSSQSTVLTTAEGLGQSFSILPGSTYSRWIICTSVGTDATLSGGITGPWSASQTVSARTGSGTATRSEVGNLITMTSGSAMNLTIDTTFGAVAGQRTDIVQGGAGIVTVVPSGVTITGVTGLRTKGAGSFATLLCTGTNTYIFTGDTQV